jgi:hypothetical protein
MAYSILLQIPVIYANQKKMFNVKFDVADFYLTIKEESQDLMENLETQGSESTRGSSFGSDKSYVR